MATKLASREPYTRTGLCCGCGSPNDVQLFRVGPMRYRCADCVQGTAGPLVTLHCPTCDAPHVRVLHALRQVHTFVCCGTQYEATHMGAGQLVLPSPEYRAVRRLRSVTTVT